KAASIMQRLLGSLLTGFACLLLVTSQRADEPAKKGDDSPVRVLILKNAPEGSERGSVKKPNVIDSADKLDKAFESKDVREEIKGKVDFKKEFLLVFSWAGSGQDKLAFAVEEGKALFLYTPGL